ncbi:ABC transporter permease [Kocuria polaris]|nr:ABC transporter permease [Kocuria polaris]
MNLILDAAAWLSDPAHWSGPGSVPTRTLEHLWVTLVVVAAAAAVALPAGVWVGHTGRGRSAVVAFAGAARAIPTLGLLTLLGLWLGIGLGAPLLALIVLAVPSLLAGAYSGVESVDRTTTSAARALGMSEWQIVTRVELPLAAPVILGGVRAATLQVIATATLAAYLANTGLGRYLFNGLKSRDYAQMLAGALLVTLLALLLEIVLASLQRRAQRLARPATGRSQSSTPMVPTKGPS